MTARGPEEREGSGVDWHGVAHSASLAGVALVLVFLYYVLSWGSLDAFVTSVDHHDRLFEDYAAYYHPTSASLASDPAPHPSYFYSSFFAVLIHPIARLELPTALYAWGVLQVTLVLLFCTVGLLFPKIRARWIPALYIALVLLAYPILHNFKWGQVSVLLTLLTVGALLLSVRGRPIPAAILLAVATAIKFYPAVFLVMFFFQREWWKPVTVFFLAVIGLYAVIPAMVLGPAGWMNFERTVAQNLSGSEWIVFDVNSQYLGHVIARWYYLATGVVPSSLYYNVMTALGIIAFLLVMAILYPLRKLEAGEAATFATILVFLALPLVVKTSWPHYFSHLPFCQLVVISMLARGLELLPRWGRITVGSLLGISIVGSGILLFNLVSDWVVYNFVGTLFLANMALMAAVLILIWGRLAGKDRVASY